MPPPAPPAAPARVAAIDILRSLVCLMMLAEVLRLPKLAAAHPDSPAWQWAGWIQTHAVWGGLTPHDLIQPMFSFLVGVSLAYSLAKRLSTQPRAAVLVHAAGRAAALVALGIFLRSTHSARTNFTFEDTLTQIGLGYFPLVLLAAAGARAQVVAVGVILVGYWALFAAWPVPPAGFDWPSVGVPTDWPHHPAGFAAHWDKNSNPAAAFDRWFLNLLPRDESFRFNAGGYCTLNFVPTLATMLLGVLAGNRLKAAGPGGTKVVTLVAGGAGLSALGLLVDAAGVCPSVKRIWTPAWVLVSGGVCALLLGAVYGAADAAGAVRSAGPLAVVGANPLVAYMLDHLAGDFVQDNLKRHLGSDTFQLAGPGPEPLLLGSATLGVFGLVLWWLAARKIFVRI